MAMWRTAPIAGRHNRIRVGDIMSAYGYRRILLKLSGEVLMGDQAYGIDPVTVARVAEEGEHPKGAHGRSWNRALSRDANKLQQLVSTMQVP